MHDVSRDSHLLFSRARGSDVTCGIIIKGVVEFEAVLCAEIVLLA